MVDQSVSLSIGFRSPGHSDGAYRAKARAIGADNEALALVTTVADHARRKLLEEILVDEDRHLGGIEEKQAQIQQMGQQRFLLAQMS
jgi:bacterioferritin